MSTKAIKEILKQAFPMTKFSVRLRACPGTVVVHYNDGPSESDVSSLISHFEYGSFDPTDDCYRADNVITGIEQFRYVSVNRHIVNGPHIESL